MRGSCLGKSCRRDVGLPASFELVTGGGFSNATKARSTRRQTARLQGNHEEADTRLILHSCEPVSEGYERLLIKSSDTDVMLFHFMLSKAAEIWMISGTARKRKCYPTHTVSERLLIHIRENLLGFHALTGCDTSSAFSGHGKNTCWAIFQSQPLLVSGIGRDGELALIEQFVFLLYCCSTLSNVNQARLKLFKKA